VTPAEQGFAGELDRRLAAASAEPGFVRALRSAGRATFLEVGFPTQKHEEWRYTCLGALVDRSFAPAGARTLEAVELPPAPRLVLVDGRVDPGASDLAGLPAGVRVGSLSAAARSRPAALEPLLGQSPAPRGHAFSALNAALFEDGALVEVDDGVACDRPLQLVFHAAGARVAAHPRNLVVLGRGARAVVVESYLGEGDYLCNPVTEVALGEGAELEHDRIQEESPEAFHLGLWGVTQAAGSRFAGRSVALGGRLGRVEARALLAGEQARCDLHGLYVASGRQLLDHLVHVDHASPRCVSREVFKGILDGSSRGVFAGRILVREGAVKTDAEQVNSNLLLSEEATVDTRPQLEILNDDVKCSHGGTVGQLREEQLFYLRSRGLPEPQARALLTWAFASEMVERVAPELRARLRRAVTGRLPHGALLREVAC